MAHSTNYRNFLWCLAELRAYWDHSSLTLNQQNFIEIDFSQFNQTSMSFYSKLRYAEEVRKSCQNEAHDQYLILNGKKKASRSRKQWIRTFHFRIIVPGHPIQITSRLVFEDFSRWLRISTALPAFMVKKYFYECCHTNCRRKDLL